jgi:enoyl-CoA hydratase/carnithine racemase
VLNNEVNQVHRWCEGIDSAGRFNINAELRNTDDFREGIAAFLEKRKPVWPSRRRSGSP